MSTRGSGIRNLTPPKLQADAVLSQANPVSTTLYTVLVTSPNVMIRSIETHVTWAVTQPTPLEVVVTIDGQTIIFLVANPVSGSYYYAFPEPATAENAQYLSLFNAYNSQPLGKAVLLEGRSVRVQMRVTWAVTQPTPLVGRVKHARW